MVFGIGEDKLVTLYLIPPTNGLLDGERVITYFAMEFPYSEKYCKKYDKKGRDSNGILFAQGRAYFENSGSIEMPEKFLKNKKDYDFDHYVALTNKRILVINFQTKNIYREFDLSKIHFVEDTGKYSRKQITFMHDNSVVFEMPARNGDVAITLFKNAQAMAKETSSISPEITNSSPDSHSQNASPSTVQPSENPLKILKIRFAKGEITKEEFEEMKAMLE